MDESTRAWVQQVVDLSHRLMELDTERDNILHLLTQLRGGQPASGTVRPIISEKRPRPREQGFVPPTSGVSKRVYDHILANPGVSFTTDQMTTALELDETKRPSVTTALSRLAQGKVVVRSGFGQYVFPLAPTDDLPEVSTLIGGPEDPIDK